MDIHFPSLMESGKCKLFITYLGVVLSATKLQRRIGKITHKTLSTTLKEMIRDGIIHRKEYPQIPPKVEYSLTEKGHSLWPIIQEMCQWGLDNQPFEE